MYLIQKFMALSHSMIQISLTEVVCSESFSFCQSFHLPLFVFYERCPIQTIYFHYQQSRWWIISGIFETDFVFSGVIIIMCCKNMISWSVGWNIDNTERVLEIPYQQKLKTRSFFRKLQISLFQILPGRCIFPSPLIIHRRRSS